MTWMRMELCKKDLPFSNTQTRSCMTRILFIFHLTYLSSWTLINEVHIPGTFKILERSLFRCNKCWRRLAWTAGNGRSVIVVADCIPAVFVTKSVVCWTCEVAKFRELFQTPTPTTVTVTLNQKSDRHPQLYIGAEKGLIVTLIKG